MPRLWHCWAAALALGPIAATFFAQSPGGAPADPAPTVGRRIPGDVTIPAGFVGNPMKFFDDFSWQTFVALNWPAADDGTRGTADSFKKLGEPSKGVVWETWKADYEIFQKDGQRPSEWKSFATQSPCKELPIDKAGTVRLFGGFATGGGLAMVHLNQADFGPPVGSLAAQNRTYARYEIRVNRTEFDFIRGPDTDESKWLYLRKNLPTGEQPSLIFPSDSIVVKAAWREFRLPQEAGLLKRYLTREALLRDPATGDCTKKTMGLVGLHIVHRTPTRREWVWSTFEHVDNLLDAPSAVAPTFTDRNQSQSPKDPQVNKLLPSVDKTHPPQDNPAAVQVVRVKPIHPSTKETNTRYRQHPDVKDTVWANYQLIVTQWPTNPAKTDDDFRKRLAKPYPAGAGNPFPNEFDPLGPGTAISNAVLETTTLFQRAVSCMQCHLSRGELPEQTEFVWFLRLRAYPSEGDLAQKMLDLLKKHTAERKQQIK